MGLNFSALIHYPGPTGDSLGVIADLEAGAEPPELREVVETGRRLGFAFAEHAGEATSWRSIADWERVLPTRPNLPCLESTLELPSGFSLMVGADAVLVGHYLRWIFFVTEGEWQRVMLGAVRWFCRNLSATDCIVTNDENPGVLGFGKGMAYRHALQVAADNGEGEVADIKSLYIDEGFSEELAFLGPDGEEMPVATWDSHGFWRLDFMGSGAA